MVLGDTDLGTDTADVCWVRMEWTSTHLRILRAIAEQGSFTAAASALGYTQSAASRQIAALERSAGVTLFERRAGGASLTLAGRALLRHASTALEELDRADRALHGGSEGSERLRVGVFESVGAALLPHALSLLRERRPDVEILTREGTTPALVRGLRAATLDLAVLASRPPYPPVDDEDPPLQVDVLIEGELAVAVPSDGDLGRDGTVSLEELQAARWISSTQTASELGMGVWPTLPRRPIVAHHARGWLTKLELVAAGHGVTTLPPIFASSLPSGVRVARVVGGAPVQRRVLLARRPDEGSTALGELGQCLAEAAEHLSLD